MAMFGNGAVIGTVIMEQVVKQILSVQVLGLFACFVAVAGSAMRSIVALPFAAAAIRRMAAIP